MTDMLYLKDCYLKEFDATVTKVDGKYITLDRTAFYPESGGQPTDTGKLVKDSEGYKVVFAKKFGSDISHEVDKEGLKVGDRVHGALDWDKRYKSMRYHTACHVLSRVIFDETSAQITGNQIKADEARIDFNLEQFDRERIFAWGEKANKIIQKNIPVELKILAREEAFQIPDLVRLKMMLPESIKEIRIVDLKGFDVQACGGTHVKNTSEIGEIEVVKAENKGKNNRRVYFKLKE